MKFADPLSWEFCNYFHLGYCLKTEGKECDLCQEDELRRQLNSEITKKKG